MEYLHNGLTLELCPGAFPLSTDSVALAGFVKLPRNARVLDLGSGCGTLGLLLCAGDATCQVTGVELDPTAHEMALKNAAVNGITDRLTSICANMADFCHGAPGSFSVCVSNPPYFSAGPASKSVPLARREDQCPVEILFACAARNLKFGGDFYLVHRPERLAELCACGAKHGLEAKRLCLLRHRSDSPVNLILMQLRKGAKPGLIIEEQRLHNADGSPTPYYNDLYHI